MADGNYNVDIPANDPVADENTRNAVALAPPIRVGEPKARRDLESAEMELASLEIARTKVNYTVSDAEFVASQVRLEQVQALFPPRIPLAPVVGNDNKGNGNGNQEQQPPWAVAMEARLNSRIEANMQRSSSCRHNRAHCDNHRTSRPRELRPLAKLVSGRGEGFRVVVRRGRPTPRRQGNLLRPEDVPEAQIGQVCPVGEEYFPRDATELHDMSEARLYTLSVWYNEDFGIDQGDDLETKRDKFMSWCKYA